jgi:hypothetical protein
MSYCKPEIQTLGSASNAIQGSTTKGKCCIDGTSDLATSPAYEADE